MGDLIVLADRLSDRSRAVPRGRAVFFYDLACPFSYLAAERVERLLGEVDWIPISEAALHPDPTEIGPPRKRQRAEQRAAELRLPLVWPEPSRAGVPSAIRAAAYAAELGAGARFGLAASRLAFCGGFDLECPEVLAEAAAAAAVPLKGCLAAAVDPSFDAALHATVRGLRARQIAELPAVRVDRRWYQGERSLPQAAALSGWQPGTGSPLAPAG